MFLDWFRFKVILKVKRKKPKEIGSGGRSLSEKTTDVFTLAMTPIETENSHSLEDLRIRCVLFT